MLLQRLRLDPDIGFNYQYMGAAEYENGATANGRLKIAEAHVAGTLTGRKVNFIEVIGKNRSAPIEVFVIGPADYIAGLSDDLEIKVSKEAFRTSDPSVAAWMQVGWRGRNFDPLLLVRTSVSDARERINNFFRDPIEYVQSDDYQKAA